MTEEKPQGARSKSASGRDQPSPKSSCKGKKSEAEEEKMKPSGPMSAYLYYTTELIPKLKAERSCTHQEAFKLAASQWKELSDKDKSPYLDKSNQDKARYEEQKKMLESKGYFLLKDGTKSCDIVKEKEDDRMKPPQPTSAYIYFSVAMAPKIKAEQKCSHLEAMKLAGATWKALSEEDKAPFYKKASEDKARYEEQMKMFNAKGYFMLSDGTKSTDYDLQLDKKKKSKSGISPLQEAPSPSVLGKRQSEGAAKKGAIASASRKVSSAAAK